ncbi:MAG: AAA family ATPase [Epsilonproteobacteria bacterium]|nr:AAA family ATPase [Campylobacterota bacterium]
MIERFYLKEHLSFQEIDLEFEKNLIIFTGPSGAGKSILMEALLTLFGLKECDAKVIEASFNRKINLDAWGIEEDEPNIFKYAKEKSARYFINNQQVSKKNMKHIGAEFINYLTLREFKEFENEALLTLLDAIITKSDKKYTSLLEKFYTNYDALQTNTKALNQIEEEEKKITDLKEFATFEIAKIEEIDPKVDEYEALMVQKKELSKKEKIEIAIQNASTIFEYETKVIDALSLLEIESSFFDESFNELRVTFENAVERLNELGDLDIDTMLDRLEKLSSLKNKYGSIEGALDYLTQKKIELSRYENIAFEKDELQKKVSLLSKEVDTLAKRVSKQRASALQILSNRVEYYLNLLYLENITFSQEKSTLHPMGYDQITVTLRDTTINKVSSGELNRIRLAQLAAASEFIQSSGGVLILDEIDANLSGKESESIAKVLQLLAQSYQIFAISHQPQLSSKAEQHFLVHKEAGISQITPLLNNEARIGELSRMISGDEITPEAIQFAKSLLEE